MEDLPRWKRDLPSVPHKLFNDAVNIVIEFYKEHLRRDIASGRLEPVDFWVMMRGLVIAAAQTYASVCLLLADKRPKPLLMQAGVLNRALFEIFSTVLALTEDPVARTKTLSWESYKSHAIRLQRLSARFGGEAKWSEYLDVYRRGLAIVASSLGVSSELQSDPHAISDEWPTPGVMIYGRPRRKVPPFVSGSRHSVLKELYEFNYPHQSAQAHGRVASLAMAMLVDDPEQQWNPGHGQSDLVVTALLLLTCTMCEAEAAGGYAPHPKLAELWTYLRDIDDESKHIWTLRYAALTAREG